MKVLLFNCGGYSDSPDDAVRTICVHYLLFLFHCFLFVFYFYCSFSGALLLQHVSSRALFRNATLLCAALVLYWSADSKNERTKECPPLEMFSFLLLPSCTRMASTMPRIWLHRVASAMANTMTLHECINNDQNECMRACVYARVFARIVNRTLITAPQLDDCSLRFGFCLFVCVRVCASASVICNALHNIPSHGCCRLHRFVEMRLVRSDNDLAAGHRHANLLAFSLAHTQASTLALSRLLG